MQGVRRSARISRRIASFVEVTAKGGTASCRDAPGLERRRCLPPDNRTRARRPRRGKGSFSSRLGRRRVALDLGGVGPQLLVLTLRRPSHRPFDLGAHVGHGDHDEAGLTSVQMIADLLEVVAAHARGRVAGDRAEDGPAGGRPDEQPAADRCEREQGYDQSGGKPDSATEYAADPGGRLVLFYDLGLAVIAPRDDGRVVGVDQPRFGMEILHELIVGLGVGDAVVDAGVGHERVDRHRALLVLGWMAIVSARSSLLRPVLCVSITGEVSYRRAVTIGAALFLIAVGAILKFAVTASVAGIDLQVVGLILMIVGALGLLLGLILAFTRGRRPPPNGY